MKKLLFFILELLLLEYFSVHPINASVLFQENFDNYNTLQWEEFLGNRGSWLVQDGVYTGRVLKEFDDNPTYSLNGNPLWKDYRFDVKIRGDIGVDKIILFRFNSFAETYAIKFISSWWDWYGDKVALLKNNLLGGWITNKTYVNTNGNWYKLSVEVKNNNIKLFINDSVSPIIDYVDLDNPILSGRIGLLVWPGGYGGGWTVNSFDDILVTSIDPPSSTPTPTPTNTPTPTPSPSPTPTLIPTPTPFPKTIILPGLGASWNTDAILNCKKDNYSDDWIIAPYASEIYQPLISSLQAEGIETYIFPYDWRQEIKNNNAPLNNFVSQKISENEKVNLIGHSMGGLLGISYLENHENNLNKLIAVGSPLKGTALAYPAWAGGDIWQDNLFMKIATTLLLKRCGGTLKNDREIIQEQIPSIQNLLPTTNYLIDQKTKTYKEINSMININNWLPRNNLNKDILSTLSGYGFDTLRAIKVNSPNKNDIEQNNWLDGKPSGKVKTTEGDGTVLNTSTQVEGIDNNILINQTHSGIIASNEGVNNLFNLLGLTPSLPTSQFIEPKSALIILGNSGNFWVRDPYGKILKDSHGIISFINPQRGKFQYGFLPTNKETLFIVAQFTEDGRIFYKEYKLKNKLPKFGTIDYDPYNPKENPLNLTP